MISNFLKLLVIGFSLWSCSVQELPSGVAECETLLKQRPMLWNKLRAENPTWNPNLDGIDLSGVNLHGINLSGLSLKGASLKGACISGADLSNSNISDADLTDVRFTDCN